MPKRAKLFLLPIIIIWILVVITGYYWGHQYIIVPPIIGMVRTLWRLAITLLIFLAALGFGRLIAGIIRLEFKSRWETFIYSEGLGLCAMALLAMGLGLIGVLLDAVFWLLTIIGAGLAVAGLWQENRRSRFQFTFDLSELQRIDYFFLVFTGISLILGLQLALSPPIGWDGITTHLVFTRDILAAGKLEPVQVFPGRIAGHMLFVWAMAIGGEVIPQLLGYGIGLIVVATAGFFTNQQFGKRTSILAVAIFVSVEVFIINAGWPYIDVVVGLLSLLAVIALVNWQLAETRSRSWLVVAAIFAVFAGHAKRNGMFVYPVMFFGVILGLSWQRHQWKSRLVDIALAFGLALFISLTWTAAENRMIADQASNLIPIPERALDVASRNGLAGVLSNAGRYLRVLWEMTIIGQQGSLIYDGTISPLFLLLLPVLFFLRDKPRIIWSLIVTAIVELASWLIFPRGYYQNRHLILAYPIFSILVAYAINRLDEFDFKWFSLSGFFRLLLIFVFSMQFLSLLVWWQGINPLGYLLGLQSRDEFLSANLNGGTAPGYYTMMQKIEEDLPEDSVVGVPRPEPRIYYCPVECVRYPFPITATSSEMISASQELNLTHVLISENGIDYWLDFYKDDSRRLANWQQYRRELDEFVTGSGELEIEQDDSFYLYKLDLGS